MSSVKGSISLNTVSAPTTINELGLATKEPLPDRSQPRPGSSCERLGRSAQSAPAHFSFQPRRWLVFGSEHIDQRSDRREVVASRICLFVQRLRLVAEFRASQRP
jgi:hypothetical protein